MKKITKQLAVVALLALAAGFSTASFGGAILEASACCVCLDEAGCVDDVNECSTNAGNQIGGQDNAIMVTSESCLDECSECSDRHLEVQ